MEELVWPNPPEEPRIRFVEAIGDMEISSLEGKRSSFLDQFLGQEYIAGKKLRKPYGVTTDHNGRIYVADPREHRIRVYDLDGKYLSAIGKSGTGDGEFNHPTNIFIRGEKLYVCDTMNGRVQVFDLEGNFLFKFGELGDAWGEFARPKGIGVDSEGHVYVVDAAFDNVQIFDEKGRLLLFFGQGGSRPGQFILPAGLHIDNDDHIYVVDSYNRRVQVFQYLKKGKYIKEVIGD